MTIRTPVKTGLRVAAYNVLSCLFLAALAVLLGMLLGPGAAVAVLLVVALGAPLGRLWWP